jgi:hypothetical protein
MPGADILVPDRSEPGIPPSDQMKTLIAGFGILFFILLLSTMYTVAPLLSETGQISGIKDGTNPYPDTYEDSTSTPDQKVTPEPVITPVIISSTPITTPVIISSTPVPIPAAPRSYVPIEAVPVPSPPVIQDITQDLPVPSTRDYFTIYSLDNEEARTTLPYVSFSLVNPPLVVEYDITPLSITDVDEIDYKIISTVYHEKLTINRPYEQSWFRIIARDRDTGKVITENGYGKTYSLEPHGSIVVYKGGNYRFEFSGEYARITLTMKVKKEGNIL